MDTIKNSFNAMYQIANFHFNLFGYSISLWNIFWFAVLGTFIIWVLREIFSN